MKSRQAPRRNVAPSLASALIALVLGAWISPLPAATGTDAMCDQSLDATPMSLADDGKLTIQVVDHGAAAASDDISLDGTLSDSVPSAAGGSKGPRAKIMLQLILDEADARQQRLPEPEQAGDLSSPLVVDKTKNGKDEAKALEANPTVAAPAQRPDFSSDEFLRYRQQMFRTDI